jgi:hypothetical protein
VFDNKAYKPNVRNPRRSALDVVPQAPCAHVNVKPSDTTSVCILRNNVRRIGVGEVECVRIEKTPGVGGIKDSYTEVKTKVVQGAVVTTHYDNLETKRISFVIMRMTHNLDDTQKRYACPKV